ncbi:MAG: hypothetical protein GC131_09440 [Alphaproteobacteria bacterium]|nr:hypothetical protein [Alphaproteobacteria bacterium]
MKMFLWVIVAVIVAAFVAFAAANGWHIAGDGTPVRANKILKKNRLEQGGFNPPGADDAAPGDTQEKP